MRLSTKIFFIIIICILLYLVNLFSTLIALLFEDGKSDAIPVKEFLIGDEVHKMNVEKHRVPKIIHQTYINESIPEQWQASQKSCIDLHPDYEYKLWTDDLSRAFIADKYPEFLETFDAYPHNIQRADSIRYFILHHYGGIYLDLDDGCARRLDVMLQYPAWLRRTIPTGISNDAMGSIPGHPFFAKTIKALPRYAMSYGMPYITVMASTGPLFLSVVWKQYKKDSLPADDHVRMLMPDEYHGNDWSMFVIAKGNSWHGDDARTIFWMGKHWLLLTVSGFAIGGLLISLLLVCWQRYVVGRGRWAKKGGKNGAGSYEMLAQEEGRHMQ